MPYGFRIRLKFPEGAKLPVAEPHWKLDEAGTTLVSIGALDRVTPLSETSDAVLVGTGYATEQEALADGSRWQDVSQVAFARLNIGVDFHERSPELAGAFSEYGLAMLTAEHGHPVLNDRPGVIVYEEPQPLFASSKAEAVVRPSVGRATATFEAARQLANLQVTEPRRLAFQLYAASFFQSSADARLLMAMMAIETLIEPQSRPREVQELVKNLMDQVKRSGLSTSQVSSLLGSMNWMLNESIGQAGRRLVSILGSRKYHGMSPAKFFARCYDLRSTLVHGHLTRPEMMEVNVHASVLQMMVGELLGAELLHVTEEWLARESDKTER
jgi:hypothetical protein